MSQTVVSTLLLQSALGSGHFGEVFSGEHPVHGRVAIKKLTRLPTETLAEWQQRWSGLLAEGQRLKAAEHDRVVRVLDVTYSATDDAVFLVMDLCTGGSLQAPFDAGPMGLERLRKLITDVALGLQAVHIRGMLHRDIKPANILCEAGRAKLGDFGLVTDNLILGYASARGYVDHLAPEVLIHGQTSSKTDLWALGMTVYRMLHGKAFYDTLPSPRRLIAAGGFAHGLPWLPHVPKRWRSFVRKLMADDPAKRFQSADQVLTAVARLPTTPDWTCFFSIASTAWERRKAERHLRVSLTLQPDGKCTWDARSYPISGSGRTRALAAADRPVSRRQATRDLEAFFQRQTP